MTDFENLKFAEPKAAVAEVYHIFMEIVERYTESAKNGTMNDALIAELHAKNQRAEDVLKYNMLEIPCYTYSLLCQYYERFMKPLVGEEWKSELKKSYDAFAAKRETKSAAGGERPLMDDFCRYLTDSFYASMSSMCRPMFKTELIQDGFIEKLRNAFKGNKE